MTPTAYPLQWPAGWPASERREVSRFRTTLKIALAALKEEVRLLGAKNLVLSSNVTLGSERPANPGVCAYFDLRGKSIAIPCDRWTKVEDNTKAIALTIEAMRGMERWGAKHMISAMFTGFTALPDKGGPSIWDVLGVSSTATEADVMTAYRLKSQLLHPDKGGSSEAFIELGNAKDLALSTIRNRR